MASVECEAGPTGVRVGAVRRPGAHFRSRGPLPVSRPEAQGCLLVQLASLSQQRVVEACDTSAFSPGARTQGSRLPFAPEQGPRLPRAARWGRRLGLGEARQSTRRTSVGELGRGRARKLDPILGPARRAPWPQESSGDREAEGWGRGGGGVGSGPGAPPPQQPAESGEATGTADAEAAASKLAGLQALQQTPWPQALGPDPADPWALSNARGASRNGRKGRPGQQDRPQRPPAPPPIPQLGSVGVGVVLAHSQNGMVHVRGSGPDRRVRGPRAVTATARPG